MDGTLYLAVGASASLLLAVTSGAWRYAFRVFGLRPSKMTVAKLRLCVTEPAHVVRVDSILASFARGFNAMIARPAAGAWRTYCEAQSPTLAPFAHEGAAMGYTVRHLFRYRPDEFERSVVKPRPEMRYLYYVGLGFWSGIRNHSAAKLERLAAGLDPLHQYLCYDGYGFQRAFFEYPKDREALRKLDGLTGYARNAAYHGVGRALWFLFMDRPDILIERVGELGDHAVDAVAGIGLASVFVFPDQLEVSRSLGLRLPAEWREHFHLGMCFALKARSINDREQFERWLEHESDSARDAVHASIRECDRIELLVRAERGRDGYRQWRMRVTAWLAGNIEFPMAGVKYTGTTTTPTVAPLSA